MNKQRTRKAGKEGRELAETIQRMAALPCLLCGRTPACGVGAWVPDNPVDRFIIGAPAGRTRITVYPLCQVCFSRPGAPERAERRIRLERLEQC